MLISAKVRWNSMRSLGPATSFAPRKSAQGGSIPFQVSSSIIACKECRQESPRLTLGIRKDCAAAPLPTDLLPKKRQRHLQTFHRSSSGQRAHTPRAEEGSTDKHLATEEESVKESHPEDVESEELEGESSENIELALRALSWYKTTVSPLLPNSCRFLPTCSSYSIQAYKEYGNVKGTILTAWRLIRCNPLNLRVQYQGKYDPPSWPPVGLEWALGRL